jgi:carboxypeptidase PM20D1
MAEALIVILSVLGGAIALLVAVVLVRALTFRPKEQPRAATGEVDFDRDAAVSALQQLVQCKTVSYYDHEKEDDAEFERLISLLPALYPEVHRVCTLERLPDRALLYRWQGTQHNAPAVMMAHYDVVPVEEGDWQKPPFAGIIENGVLWGRGTLDTKVTMNGVLSAANALIAKGFVPKQDVYFAFSGGEEVNGNGAKNVVEYFQKEGIVPALVLDEGGAVVEKVFPGVKAPCAMVGIAEKGMMNLTFSVESGGGHASAPAPHTPITRLAEAVKAVNDNPFPMHVTKPAAEMFDTLGRHSTLLYRVIFANLWLFKGVLDGICKKSGGELNALLRTTVAFTQASGSTAPNVIPPRASVTANLRLNPADSVESAMARIRKTVKNEEIRLELGSHMEPSRISVVDRDAYARVAAAVSGTWQGCLVSPYLMVQCSDCRHWGAISDRVYRFSAMALTAEERKTIHGNNERIRLDAIHRAVEFYIRLMQQC